MSRGWSIVAGMILAGVGVLAAPARAQQMVPVDQGVDDLDLLARSFRQVELGLRADGQGTALYQLVPDGSTDNGLSTGVGPVYYRVGPGFRARVYRMDYLVVTPQQTWGMDVASRHDNEFIELVPPGVIYDLRVDAPLTPNQLVVNGPAAKANAPLAAEASNRIEPRRRDNRLDNRLVLPERVNNALTATNGPTPAP